MKESALWFLARNGQMYKKKCTNNYRDDCQTSFFIKTGKTNTLKSMSTNVKAYRR